MTTTTTTQSLAHYCPMFDHFASDKGLKEMVLGVDDYGCDFKVFGATSGVYMLFDESANALLLVGAALDLNGSDLDLNDADELRFGDSQDVTMQWDATNFLITAAADDSLIEFGDSGATQKSFDLKWYANENSGASYVYFDASANLIYTTGVDLQFKDNDILVIGTGGGANGDVQVVWDATNLIVKAIADDTVIEIGDAAATQLSFDVKWYANEANGASLLTFDASENLIFTTGVDLQFKDNDVLAIGTGAGAAGDVSVVWDGTNLIVKAAADDEIIEIGDSAATQLSFDVKWYANEANGASYFVFDAGANLLYTTGVDLQFLDSDYLVFGTGAGATGDVNITWDGTNLILATIADDKLIEIGDAAATQLSFDLKWYANENAGASYLYFDASINAIVTAGVDAKFGDNDHILIGTKTNLTTADGDVDIYWDATNLIIAAGADNTVIEIGDSAATQLSFDVKIYGEAANGADYILWDASESNLEFTGDARIDFSGATILAANTDGGLIKAGTEGSPVVEDTANMKFMSFYFDNGALSGDNRGIYNRLFLTGAGGGGESFRTYTTVQDVAAGTAHGAHTSLGFGTSGSITGLGVAQRCTLEPAAGAMTAGTYAPIQSEIFCAASADMSGVTDLSMFRVAMDGNATAVGLVDHKASLFTLSGNSIDTGHMMAAKASAAVSHVIRIMVDSTPYYLMVSNAI